MENSKDQNQKPEAVSESKPKPPKTMRFDNIFPIIGEFGRYQKRIYLLLCLPAICCAMHKLAWVFIGARVDFRCQMPFESEDAAYNEIFYNNTKVNWNLTYPKYSDELICRRYDTNFTEEYFESNTLPNSTTSCGENYIFDKTTYSSSAVQEYKLVCDKKNRHADAQSLFMVGILIGSLFGDLSDRFGRRPVFFFSLVIQVVFGILAGVAPNFITFVLARMVVGASTSGVFLVGFVIAMEMVGPSKRVVAGVICQLFFTTGYLVTALFAYFIKDWKYLQIALTVPGIAFFCYYWFLPESVRWLLAKGKKDEAKKILEKVAIENKCIIPDEVLQGLTNEEPPKASVNLLHIVYYPNLLFRSINIFFSWMVNSGVYYGLSLYTSNLGGNDYLNFAISGAVEVPAYLFILFTLNRLGRKSVLSGCMLAGGISMAACAFVPDTDEMRWLLITLSMLGKLCITASYGVIYILSAENFPTVIRNSGVGVSSMFARVGGIIGNYLLLLGETSKTLPILIFGGTTIVAGILALFIPETLGKRLPETIEDGVKFGTKEYEDIQDVELKDITCLNSNSNHNETK